jgi:hypothetical protein
MAQMLQIHTKTTKLHKVRAHTNIDGVEQVDTLANSGHKLDHTNAVAPYEHTCPFPHSNTMSFYIYRN